MRKVWAPLLSTNIQIHIVHTLILLNENSFFKELFPLHKKVYLRIYFCTANRDNNNLLFESTWESKIFLFENALVEKIRYFNIQLGIFKVALLQLQFALLKIINRSNSQD